MRSGTNEPSCCKTAILGRILWKEKRRTVISVVNWAHQSFCSRCSCPRPFGRAIDAVGLDTASLHELTQSGECCLHGLRTSTHIYHQGRPILIQPLGGCGLPRIFAASVVKLVVSESRWLCTVKPHLSVSSNEVCARVLLFSPIYPMYVHRARAIAAAIDPDRERPNQRSGRAAVSELQKASHKRCCG
jgi:hypothetical protein